MDDKVLDNLRELNILIKKKLFFIGKCNGIATPPSPLQVRIFIYIYEREGNEVSQAELTRELKGSKVSISEAISKMVSNGNLKVISSKSDARKNIVTITDQGIEIMNNMIHSFEILEKEMLKDIERCDFETFIKVMQHMKKNIEEEEYV